MDRYLPSEKVGKGSFLVVCFYSFHSTWVSSFGLALDSGHILFAIHRIGFVSDLLISAPLFRMYERNLQVPMVLFSRQRTRKLEKQSR